MRRACLTALRVAEGAEGMERLLRCVLDASGAERVFLATGESTSIRLTASLCDRGDGLGRPSRSALQRALAGPRPLVLVEDEVNEALTEASVRSLDLRSILSVPVPVEPPGRAALVIDSRRALGRPSTELREALDALAALLALASRNLPAPPSSETATVDAPEFPSPAHREMTAWVRRIAPSELPVLVLGESGSGKEGVSRALHRLSRRESGPFLALNCAAVTETLLEAELFGASRGAYTGADRDRPGLFALAHGGTLLLDEVGDMPPSMQAKLLRVLEEGRVRPVGGQEEREVDVRIVAASHRDLETEVRRGRFRDDLYYRIAVLRVDVPPLRRRPEDLPLLVDRLAPRLRRETGFGPPRLDEEAWHLLRDHSWPGNVRELHAVLARALLRTTGAEIGAQHLEPVSGEDRDPATASDGGPTLEQSMIESALEQSGGSVTLAAGRIGWSRQKLYRRMTALGFPRN